MAEKFLTVSTPQLAMILQKLSDSRSNGGMVMDGQPSKMNQVSGLSPADIQQLATYLYTLGEDVKFLHANGTGGQDTDTDPLPDDTTPSQPGEPDEDIRQLDLSNSTLFPFRYGLLYDNRNEFSAQTSSGGAWLARVPQSGGRLERNENLDIFYN